MRFILNEEEDNIQKLPLEDGTTEELLKEVEKNKEKEEKAYNKYIDDAEKIIDDVNKSDEKIYVKPLKEKLVLSEDEDLEEALPRDLADLYREKKTKLGHSRNIDRPKFGYKKIRGFDPNGIDFENSEYTEITPEEAIAAKKRGDAEKLRIIFDGKLVTYEADGKHQHFRAERDYNSDASKYKKPNGDRVDNSSKLTFNTVVQNADKIYITDEKDKVDYPDRGGDYQSPRYGDRMRKDHPEYSDTDYYSARFLRHGLPVSSLGQESDYINKNYWSAPELDRGSGRDILPGPYSKRTQFGQVKTSQKYKDRQGNIDRYEKQIQSDEKDKAKVLADIEMIKNGQRADTEYYWCNSDESALERANTALGNIQYRIDNYTQYLNNELRRRKSDINDIRDTTARYRYGDSEMDLRGIFHRFIDLKRRVNNKLEEVKKAKREYEASVEQGSPRARAIQRDIDDYKARLQDIQNRINDLQAQLAQEDNNEAAQKASDELDKVALEYVNIKNELKKIMDRKKNESLTEALDTLTDDGDYRSLEPEGHLAKKIYALITGSEKLDKLSEVIKELFPEGISLTGLWDIFNFDPYFILDELGIEIPDDLIKNLEPDEEETEEVEDEEESVEDIDDEGEEESEEIEETEEEDEEE